MKKALFIILGIIAAILLVALILPSTVHVERSIVVNTPPDVAFAYVVDLQKNQEWSPWAEKDPNMKIEWGEQTAGLGASYSWEGNDQVGSGTMTISEVRENEFIKNDLDFGEMGKGSGTWKFEVVDGDAPSTNVTWGMDSELGWPIGRYFGLFMDGMVGPDFEKGLSNLKNIAESAPAESGIEVIEMSMDEPLYLAIIKDSMAIDQMGESMGMMFGQLVEYIQKTGLEVTSYPICRYHVWDDEKGYTVFEAALPIASGDDFEPEGNIELAVIEPGNCVKVVHKGEYEGLMDAHLAIEAWLTENQREMNGSPWEVYVTDPQEVQNPEDWITEVIYPIM